jgi:peptidoglycan/xylan/chitin deacetylase (PgdA/CDA1 family)
MTFSAYERWKQADLSAENRPIQNWKDVVATGIHRSGLLRVSESLADQYAANAGESHGVGPRAAIVCYHRIGTDGVPVYNGLPAKIFESQIAFLRTHYRVVSLEKLVCELKEGGSTKPSVAITFDDGYVGTYLEAFPILKRYQVPATVYLTVGSIETGEIAWYDKIFLAFQVAEGDQLTVDFEGESLTFSLGSRQGRLQSATSLIRRLRNLPNRRRVDFCRGFDQEHPLPSQATRERMLNWRQAIEMLRDGVSFGGHTMTHPVVSTLTPDETLGELAESKTLAEERLGEPVLDFAFPFGDLGSCGQHAVDLLPRLGYRSAVSMAEGINTREANPFLLRRTGLVEYRCVSFAAIKLNDLFWRGSTSPATCGPGAIMPRLAERPLEGTRA